MDWNMVGVIVGSLTAVITLLTAFMTWFMSRLENRLDTAIARLDVHMAETSQHFEAVNARSDALQSALNARIDTTQAIIMRMLEKKGM